MSSTKFNIKFCNSSFAYSFQPVPGIKFIGLNCYDVSIIGEEPSSLNYQKAAEILNNYHHDSSTWNSYSHLEEANKRFATWNGAIGREQLKWLSNELDDSDFNGDQVIIFGHSGIHPDSIGWPALIWNCDEVLNCLKSHRSVVAYLCGHQHDESYFHDLESGIHFVAFRGIVESNPKYPTFATVTITDDMMIINGNGEEESRKLLIPNKYLRTELTPSL